MTSIDETCGGAPIRVAIADDQDLVRKGFRLILSSFSGIEAVGEAVDAADALPKSFVLTQEYGEQRIYLTRANASVLQKRMGGE